MTNRKCLFVLGLLVAAPAVSQTEIYSPYVGQDFPKYVYFGDTHVHTNISYYAYGDGNIRMSAEEADRFAKGEELEGL